MSSFFMPYMARMVRSARSGSATSFDHPFGTTCH